MAKDDSKVFDVSKPGESKPETGSKPMVVGHKLMKDPSISEVDNNKDEESVMPIAQTSKLIINPISDDEKEDNKTEPKESDSSEDEAKLPDEKPEEKTIAEPEIETTTETEEVKQDNEPEKVNTEAKKDEEIVDDAVSNEENLQKIVSEKTYFVDIKEASYTSAKSFVTTFIVVGLIAIVAIALLIDLGVLDLGIELPFDFL
jgi:hypothetical protein